MTFIKYSFRTSFNLIKRRNSSLDLSGHNFFSKNDLLISKTQDHACQRFIFSGKKKNQTSPLNWKSLAISSGIVGILFGGAYYLKREKELKLEVDRRRSLGKASIGGKFELIDQDKKIRTNRDFLGNWCLIYFGFSHCPDVCPDEMEKMIKVINNIENSKINEKIIPIFISVDPERDTPEIVKSYVAEFSDKIVGLTGTKEQIKDATKAYRVYYSAGPKSEDNDYIVDHTIIMYLINPDGEFVDYYGQNKDADQITNGVILSMAKYKAMKKSSWL